jgi:hypothetical protein
VNAGQTGGAGGGPPGTAVDNTSIISWPAGWGNTYGAMNG